MKILTDPLCTACKEKEDTHITFFIFEAHRHLMESEDEIIKRSTLFMDFQLLIKDCHNVKLYRGCALGKTMTSLLGNLADHPKGKAR